MLPTKLSHDLDNLCEVDLSVINTAQTPPQSFKYHTEEGAAWKSPLTGDRLTQAEAWLFDNPAHVSTPDPSVKRNNCYICRDPDFARMGLPLCSACRFCSGHVAADSSTCDDCEKEQLPDCTGCGTNARGAASAVWMVFGIFSPRSRPCSSRNDSDEFQQQ